ncbi:MAG: hypothetical protein QXX23_07005 [Thermoplasmata archaeon]
MEPWNKQRYKVAILIPHGDMVYFPFALALAQLNPPQPSFYILQKGLSLHEVRDYMVDVMLQTKNYESLYIEVEKSKDKMIEQSLDSGAEYIFFLDSDIIVPPNTIQKLMRWYYPVTVGVYWKKQNSPHTSLYMFDEKTKKFNGIQRFYGSSPFYVDGSGMGLALIDTRIFKKLSPPWFLWEHYKVNPNRYSEDLYFCRKLWEELGIKILVDSEVRGTHVGMGGVRDEGQIYIPEI